MKEQIQRLIIYEIMTGPADMGNIKCDKKPIPPKNITQANIDVARLLK
jgi:hypothetical protein